MVQYLPSGDSALLLKFGNEISEAVNKEIRSFVIMLQNAKIEGVLELIPSYTDLLIHYDPLKISYQDLLEKLKTVPENISKVEIPEARTIRIPVLYGDRFGENLDVVKNHTGLSETEIVDIHTASKYLVYMLGFTPGFCYLGGMNQQLATPRKEIPSEKIVAGAIGIAAGQTGIYPIDSPGGWQIIGRTPYKLFDPKREPAFLVHAGDYLEFYSITDEEYNKMNEND
jgi:inhibitor of KinA